MSDFYDDNDFMDNEDDFDMHGSSPGFIDEDQMDEDGMRGEIEYAHERDVLEDEREREEAERYDEEIEDKEDKEDQDFADNRNGDMDDDDFTRSVFEESSHAKEPQDEPISRQTFDTPSRGIGIPMFDREEEDHEPEEDPEDTTLKEDIVGFVKDSSKKGIAIKIGIGFLLILYVLEILLQNFDFVNSSTFEHTIEPFRLTANMITYMPMFFLIALVIALMYVVWMILFLKKKGVHATDQGFVMSEKNTYGSAKFATDAEMQGALDFFKENSPKGIVLGYNADMRQSVCVPKEGRNQNVAVFGPSGSGKSYSFARPNILSCIAGKKSYVVTDPSGELFRDTAKFAQQEGMTVRVLNLKDFEASNGWQCFRDIKGKNAQTKATAFATTALENTKTVGAKADAFFDNAELNLFKSLVLYVAMSDEFHGAEYERNIGTVYDLIATLSEEVGGETESTFIDIMNNLSKDDPAKQPWQIFMGAGKLRNNICLGLAVRLQVFQDKLVREVFTHDEIDLALPGKEPCAYYVIVDAQNNIYNFLLSLFFSSFFDSLIGEAEKNMNNKLTIPVYFLLDEFKAIGIISDFSDKLANVRKYGISISMIFQNPQQVEENYPHQSTTILSNCDTQLVLGCNDMDTAKDISARSGVATIINEGSRIDRPTMTPVFIPTHESMTTGDGKRMLLNPDDVIRANKFGDVLIICRGENVYKAKKYGFDKHRLAKYIQDPGNHILANAYIPRWQHDGDITADKTKMMLEYIYSTKTKAKEQDEQDRQAQYQSMAKEMGGSRKPKQRKTVSRYAASERPTPEEQREKELRDQMIHEGSSELDGSKFGDNF